MDYLVEPNGEAWLNVGPFPWSRISYRLLPLSAEGLLAQGTLRAETQILAHVQACEDPRLIFDCGTVAKIVPAVCKGTKLEFFVRKDAVAS